MQIKQLERRLTECGGIDDWFSCIRCEHICTSGCPIEGDIAGLADHTHVKEHQPAEFK